MWLDISFFVAYILQVSATTHSNNYNIQTDSSDKWRCLVMHPIGKYFKGVRDVKYLKSASDEGLRKRQNSE